MIKFLDYLIEGKRDESTLAVIARGITFVLYVFILISIIGAAFISAAYLITIAPGIFLAIIISTVTSVSLAITIRGFLTK